MPTRFGGAVNAGPTSFDQLVDGRYVRRRTGSFPAPPGHPLRMRASWSRATGIPTIPKADWEKYQFTHVHAEVPTLDQTETSSCVGHAGATTGMVLNVRSGAPHVDLSAFFLYTLIDNGEDQGATGADAVDQMQKVGIAPLSLVPGQPIAPPGVNSAALQAAGRFRLGGAFPVTTIEELVTAVVFGWQLMLDVEAGPPYDTDGDGVIAYLGGDTNHEQSCGEGLKLDRDGNPMVLDRNSWGLTWGGGGGLPKGFGWLQYKHLLAARSVVACQWMLPDPTDPTMVPLLAYHRARVLSSGPTSGRNRVA